MNNYYIIHSYNDCIKFNIKYTLDLKISIEISKLLDTYIYLEYFKL